MTDNETLKLLIHLTDSLWALTCWSEMKWRGDLSDAQKSEKQATVPRWQRARRNSLWMW
jgi:hypothetical protein